MEWRSKPKGFLVAVLYIMPVIVFSKTRERCHDIKPIEL